MRGGVKPSGSSGFSSLLLIAESLTPLHVGVGRAPGVVDLPVARDGLGYPFVPASGVKGALKRRCLVKAANGNLDNYVDDSGRIDCSKGNDRVKACCCLFGPEPGKGDKGSGVLSVLDMMLLAMPAPSADHGYVYVTTAALLLRSSMIAEAVGAGSLASELMALSSTTGKGEVVDIAGVQVKATKASLGNNGVLSNAVGSLKGLASKLPQRLYIISDDVGPHVINKALLRVSRIRLRRDKKVVSGGALWTEEYVPAGALFIGGIVKLAYHNEYCSKDLKTKDDVASLCREYLGIENGSFIVLGGKETIGRGILKVSIPGGGNDGGK